MFINQILARFNKRFSNSANRSENRDHSFWSIFGQNLQRFRIITDNSALRIGESVESKFDLTMINASAI